MSDTRINKIKGGIMDQHIKWRSAAAVENGHLRDSYRDWIDDFLKCEDLIEKKERLNRDREQVKAAPRALADVKKSFLSSLKNFVEVHQVNALKQFISSYSRSQDPAFQLRGEHLDSPLRVFSLWPDDLIDRAFDELAETWPEDAVTDAERKKQLDSIDREDAKIVRELAKYPDFPKWLKFVNNSRVANSRVRVPIDPQGFALDEGKKPGEKEALAKLELHKYNNPKSNFIPAAP
jgi:hypothetical protein